MTGIRGTSAKQQWPPWERYVVWRLRHTPYQDVPRFSPYRRRYEPFLADLRAASHFPVIRAQTHSADLLESRIRYRLRFLETIARILTARLGRPAVRALVYCVDCGAEARVRRLRRRLVGPLSGEPCPGRPDGSEPLSARVGVAR